MRLILGRFDNFLKFAWKAKPSPGFSAWGSPLAFEGEAL